MILSFFSRTPCRACTIFYDAKIMQTHRNTKKETKFIYRKLNKMRQKKSFFSDKRTTFAKYLDKTE